MVVSHDNYEVIPTIAELWFSSMEAEVPGKGLHFKSLNVILPDFD
jgi:hypothetical protein